MIDFDLCFGEYIDAFNRYVSAVFDKENFNSRKSSGSELMLESMTYSLENGGKRIRPVLCLEFCKLCGGNWRDALPFALAVEMIHTYSLIHDDLPCMDDDDMRRGRKSNHIVFGEANALLAGDGLLTMAFEVLSSYSALEPEKVVEAVTVLSKAAGFTGMIAGQAMDLQNENRDVVLDDIRNTDYLKTGEMIRAAAALGCIAAGADNEKRTAADRYCSDIGLAFQIVDDILDVVGDADKLGKPIGSDDSNSKSTYVSLLGLEKSKDYVNELTDDAMSSLEMFGERADFLKKLALNLSERKY